MMLTPLQQVPDPIRYHVAWPDGGERELRLLLARRQPCPDEGSEWFQDARPPRVRLAAVAVGYAQALYLAGRVAPDVVLLDCFDDRIDVLDALAALKGLSRSAVLLHGRLDPERRRRALAAGAVDVLEDGSGAHEMLAAIRRAGRRAPPLAATPVPSREPPAPGDTASHLTARERELVLAILSHPSAKYLVIGAHLGISEHTVHNHLSSIYQKLNLVNRADLLVYAVRHRIFGDGGALAAPVQVQVQFQASSRSAASTAKKPNAASRVHLSVTSPQRR